MQMTEKKIMARRMFQGASGGRSPESFWKNTNQGNLMPACRNTPADAATSRYQISIMFCSAAPELIIDLEMKPEVQGKAEIASAPIVPQMVVSGMVRNRPPRLEHLLTPV